MSVNNVEKSPTGSDYSLPWLDPDETQHYVDDIDIWGMSDGYELSAAERTAITPNGDGSGVLASPEMFPLSATPSRLSPVSGSTSQERSDTIRRFPLQDLLESPNFLQEIERLEQPIVEPRKMRADLADTSETVSDDHNLTVPQGTVLCPWCDEVLPKPLSVNLSWLISMATKRSKPSPRPTNVYGLKAEVKDFSSVCSTHDAEKTDLVLAEVNGWPKDVDWKVFIQRAITLRPQLQRIIDDVDEDWRPPLHNGSEVPKREEQPLEEIPEALAKRPRKESRIWKSLVNDILSNGYVFMTGVLGQWSDFENKLPGYYGEIGTYILSTVLWHIFPDDVFPQDSTYPLSVYDFRQSVLLPEAATALIMQDTGVNHYKAIQTMSDSARYGTLRFAHNGDDVYDELLREAFPTGLNVEHDGHLCTHLDDGGRQPSGSTQSVLSVNDVHTQPSEIKRESSGESMFLHTASTSACVSQGNGTREWSTSPAPGVTNPFSPDYVRSRTRRRKISRSSIPRILAPGKGDEDHTSSDGSPISKKTRLV